jgi:hypothetical protein
MSTIKLYKNNITLRLPILKFINSKNKFRIDSSNKKENSLNKKESLKNNEELIRKNIKKRILSLSKLQDSSLNSKTFRIENKNEKAVQTLQINNINKFKIKKEKKLLNILNYTRSVLIKEQKKINNDNILRGKIYKINQKNRKKLLQNYSQINSYYNKVHDKKIKDDKDRIFDYNKIYKMPIYGQKIEKNTFYNNKLNLNKTQENIEIKSIKKYISLAHLFHKNSLIKNIKKEKKIELNKENFNNDFDLSKSIIHRNNSLPNFHFKLGENNTFINEDNSKLIKSNGKFLSKTFIFKDKNIK